MYYFCLCKSFKELFLSCLTGVLSCLAGAKVRLFSEPPKLFHTFFMFSCDFYATLDLRQDTKGATPYYIINGKDGPKEFCVSAGFGIPLQSKWNIQNALRPELNISAQWTHASAKDLITENTFRINLGLTFNERWFSKFKIR